MNWLDTQTKAILQRVQDDKLAPAKTAEFALVLLRKGSDQQRLVDAIVEINKCSEADAGVLASRSTPVTINAGLKEEEALWGQFELVCCDAISVFLRSEVVEQNDGAYLRRLFKKVSESPEFRWAAVSILRVPTTESGEKFLQQFVGPAGLKCVFPITLTMPFKKARIMEHWASRVGAQITKKAFDAKG